MTKNTELLLPVGNMEMCLAAIHNGANAIYMGVSGFNARGRSQDISPKEAKEIIDLCHLYGVRVNLAFNVVIFQNELEAALKTLMDYIPLGPDAFIVQDLGLARLIRTLAPEQPVHASTQMTMTSFEGIRLLDDLGIKRFVLGRENTIEEIKIIRDNTDKELEVFVHGALCVAYSGQCFTSESIGGRSANRGQCAQSCRLSYDMFVDGEKKELGAKRYLVSPQDLCGIEEAPELARIGVDSLKVEGRLKAPEYVAAAAKSYSLKLQGLEYDPNDLALTYSRGFFSGWLHGVDHQKLVPADHSSHRGVELGPVIELKDNIVTIETLQTLSPGQGLLFIGEGEPMGAKIFKVLKAQKGQVQVQLLKNDQQLRIKKGAMAHLNSDPKRQSDLSQSFRDFEKMKKISLKISSKVQSERLVLSAFDGEKEYTVISDARIEPVLKRPTEASDLEKELSKLGRSPFKIGKYEHEEGAPFYFSQKSMKALRRKLVEEVQAGRSAPKKRSIDLSGAEVLMKSRPASSRDARQSLNILIREKEQLEALEDVDVSAISSVTLDYEFGKDYRESIALLKEKGIKAGVATTRIHKPKEYYNLNMLVRLAPDFILARNLGALAYLQDKGIELKADFSFNITNHLSFDYLLTKNVSSICASYDLNQDQLLDLANRVDASKLEVVLHQYMPEFHMEHCVFAAFLSKGSSFRDCGKPCEKHKVELRDVYGQYHHLKADQECRNTFFRGAPQSAGFMMEEIKKAGIGQMRIEALYEGPKELARKINLYSELVKGSKTYASVRESLDASEKYGVSQGQL